MPYPQNLIAKKLKRVDSSEGRPVYTGQESVTGPVGDFSKALSSQSGRIQYALLILVIILAIFLTGTLFVKTQYINPASSAVNPAALKCCNTGDGADCKPQTGTGQTLDYKGQSYGLLRSDVKFVEGSIHLEDSQTKTSDGKPIIINDSGRIPYPHQQVPGITAECEAAGRDKYFRQYIRPDQVNTNEARQYCTTTADDAMIFVCKQNCHPASCPALPPGYQYIGNPSCYGESASVYDVYYRVADYQHNGKVEDFIANCDKAGALADAPPAVDSNSNSQQIVYNPGSSSDKNLQLRDFEIKEGTSSAYVPWLSPFCKPAIYLYPERPMTVNVKVAPVGPMNYTIPTYPADGWTVLANPNGDVKYQSKTYDYLYYEAKIPDDQISEPNQGYTVKYAELNPLFDQILPKLGLNTKESDQFKEYWLKVLPEAPFYEVRIISESNLDHIAPLTFSVKPDSIKRVTLSFKPVDHKTHLAKPTISPFTRSGFTVIEWGGIFKKTPGYKFSCFM